MTNLTDPREIIDKSPMTAMQIVVVVITVLLNGLDGFDVASIAFASPGISADWGVARTALGIVLSMELLGMGFGALIFGGFADKRGRRPTLLVCLAIMAIGMFGATRAADAFQLSLWRVFTGLGIGGMLTATNAVVAEFSSKRWRSLSVSMMVIGYPLFAGIGGLYAATFLNDAWRPVFYIGATASAIMLPVVYFLVPESVHWLARKQPAGALTAVNASLTKMGQSTVTELPHIEDSESKKSLSDIFSPALLATTLIVTSAFFLHVMTFYFLLKWTPKIVSDMAFNPAEAGNVLTMANFGGAVGGALFGVLTARIGLKPLTIAILALNGVAIMAFGRSPQDLGMLTTLAVIAGFFGNAGMSGLYALVAWAFPTHARAMGTGFVIGMGRGGAFLSPIIAGFLLDSGLSLPSLGMVMGSGSLLGAVILLFLKAGNELQTQRRQREAEMEPSAAH